MSAKKAALLSFALTTFLFLLFLSIFYKQPETKPAQAQGVIISGKIDLNGYIPPNSTIEIGERIKGTGEFTIVATDLTPQDGTMWYWTGAQVNSNYELVAYLKQGTKTLAQSPTLTVSAPAADETLSINSKLKESPLQTVLPNPSPSTASASSTPKPNISKLAMLSGSIDLNGHIPDGSTLEVVQRQTGSPTFEVAQDNILPTDGISWVWKNAEVGREYEIQAYIKNQGKVIGESQVLKVAAPALNETLVINSIAQPLVPETGAVSGKINLNGQIPQGNISIVVYQRVQGTSKFNVAQDTISPSDGAVWSWGNAVSGTTYELIAILKQQNSPDLATSPVLTVSAPAGNEILTLNTKISLPPPNGNPTISCINQTSVGQWNITMKVSPYNNASEYLLQIGSQSGGTDILNTKVDLSGNIQAGAVVNNNTPYYAWYAYGFCTNCPNTSFSAFSNAFSFTCPPQAPSPSPYTGYVCSNNVCQLTTQPNPPYLYNNQGLAQCQLNCKATPVPTTPTPIPTATPTTPPTSAPTTPPTPVPTQAPTPVPTAVPTPAPTAPPPPSNAPLMSN